jgi:hypothetical protein
MKKNKWKIAFWALFAMLIVIVSTGVYTIIDQGYSYSYLSDDDERANSDLDVIKGVIVHKISKTDFPKALFDDSISDYLALQKTTIYFDSCGLVSRVASTDSVDDFK